MSLAAERVSRTRALLLAGLLAIAVSWGAVVWGLVAFTTATIDLFVGLDRGVREGLGVAGWAAAAAAAVAVIWRSRGAMRRENVALWIEEHLPWLRYALVTALESRSRSAHPMLDPMIGEAQWGGVLALAVGRALLKPIAALLIVVTALLLLPRGALSRAVSPSAGDLLDRATPGAVTAGSRLSPLVATVVAPAYAGGGAERHDDPTAIIGLPGSRIRVEGRGDPRGLTAGRGDEPLAPTAHQRGWRVDFILPAQPSVLRLVDGRRERLVALEPRTDRPPDVVLQSPRRDSVMREARGVLSLAAAATDDLGLGSASFEYIISSGEGESFTFRSGSVGVRQLAGARRAELTAALSLDALALGPGDVLHLRAIAADRNDVAGPSIGASETRTLRVARRGEYDSLAVEGAPPPAADSSLLSQRMLLLLTERLEARRPRLERPVVVEESRTLAADQHRLRRRVSEIIFLRLEGGEGDHSHGVSGHDEHDVPRGEMTPEELLAAADAATGTPADSPLDYAEDESPVVAINRPLLEAYNHMWDAARALDVGEPDDAIPPMRRALEALQRARQSERYYLRGRTPAVVVDIARIRMQGGPPPSPAPVRGRPADERLRRREARLGAAIALVDRAPDAAIDSLMLLRIDLLDEAPALAAAVGGAIAALREGRDAGDALRRARRLTLGEPVARDSLVRWGRW